MPFNLGSLPLPIPLSGPCLGSPFAGQVVSAVGMQINQLCFLGQVPKLSLHALISLAGQAGLSGEAGASGQKSAGADESQPGSVHHAAVVHFALERHASVLSHGFPHSTSLFTLFTFFFSVRYQFRGCFRMASHACHRPLASGRAPRCCTKVFLIQSGIK